LTPTADFFAKAPKQPRFPFAARLLGKALPFAALACLAGCANAPQMQRLAGGLSGPGAVDPRYGVRASPRVVADGEEVPRGGGAYMVGKPYKIAGKTYYPSERPNASVGLASWYGSDFHGRRTANGEVFDRGSVSAAHPTMPLPSYARVTNLRNSRSMVVRVNDRGPYHGGRVMDVSQRVAEALDFDRIGTARVKVEWIGKAELAGSDDARLLATLRDDGRPAALEGFTPEPVMTAQREEPIHTASLERARAYKPAVEETASDAAPAESRPGASASAPHLAKAPAPPSRPFDLGPAAAPAGKTTAAKSAAAPLPPAIGRARPKSAMN
jgi:rare lipoprotein A